MKSFYLALPFVLITALIVHTLGSSIGGLTIWNCLPVAAAFGVLVLGLRWRQRSVKAAAITFSVVAALVPALVHLAWIFDWGGTATGSSTSGLVFLVVPVWSGGFAVLAAVIAWSIVNLLIRFGWKAPPYREGYCSKCGYDLTGNVSGICPECGTAVSPETG